MRTLADTAFTLATTAFKFLRKGPLLLVVARCKLDRITNSPLQGDTWRKRPMLFLFFEHRVEHHPRWQAVLAITEFLHH